LSQSSPRAAKEALSIPLRNFGKTGVQISALGLGGHHLGGAKDEKTDIDIVHRALFGRSQRGYPSSAEHPV